MRYADAGVNISTADEAKRRIAAMAGKTFRRGVLAPIGGFGALFQLDRKRWRDPVLVASADGVGHQAEDRLRHGRSFHRRRRYPESLRERHSHAGRRAAFFSRLPGDGKAGHAHRRTGDRRNEPRREAGGLRADRRRNGGDARFLRAGRIRPGGLHRRRRRTKKTARSAPRARRATCCSRFPPAACTPTAIRSRASWSSASRSSSRIPTSPKSATRSAPNF